MLPTSMKEYLKLIIFVGVIVFFLAQIPPTETPRSLRLPPPKNVVVETSYFANNLNLVSSLFRCHFADRFSSIVTHSLSLSI